MYHGQFITQLNLANFSTTIEASDEGVNIIQVMDSITSKGHSEGDIKRVIESLASEGEIYSTIDENTFKVAE